MSAGIEALDRKIETQLSKEITSIKSDISRLQQAVYGDLGPDFRFEKLEKRCLGLETLQKQDFDHFTRAVSSAEELSNNYNFQLDNRLKQVECLQPAIMEFKQDLKRQQQVIDESLEKAKEKQQNFMEMTNQTVARIEKALVSSDNKIEVL